jgi:uncharacterized damage-inducible protein DinB
MIERPQPDEYPPFAAKYVDLVSNGPIIEILEYLQQMNYNFFLRIDPDKASYAYAEGKWTLKQVLGHMADTERVFAYRALVFSRESIELPGFDQDVYMEKATFNDRTLEDLAEEFRTVRETTLYLLKSLTEEQTRQKGIASGNPVSVRGLAYMIAGHELHHIKILKERYL